VTPIDVYKELYLRLVEWGRRTHGVADMPEHNAVIGLATLAMLNVASIFMLGELAWGRGALIPRSRISVVCAWLGLLALHYANLTRLGRQAAAADGSASRGQGMGLVVAYAIITIATYIGLLLARS